MGTKACPLGHGQPNRRTHHLLGMLRRPSMCLSGQWDISSPTEHEDSRASFFQGLLPREAVRWTDFHWCPEYEALGIGHPEEPEWMR